LNDMGLNGVLRSQFLCQFTRRSFAVDIVDGDIRTFCCESAGNFGA
jgi:hypothetical protein